MPLKPLGAKFEKWSPLKAVNATAMKNSSTPIFVMTITVLVRALSLIPAMSSAATPRTRKTAGRFTLPPSPGGSAIDAGREMPNRDSSSSLR